MNGIQLGGLIKERQPQLLNKHRKNKIMMEDKKMAPIKGSIMSKFTLVGILSMALFLLAACGDGDGTSVSHQGSGTIMIYNYDNRDYQVELRQTSDDTVLGSLTIRDYNILENNWIDSFEDVPEGIFYLIIFRDGYERDRSNNFYIDEEDTVCYLINDRGILEGC